ncbi:glycosyltransferase family 9 protein [Leptospirillum ferriphilum]|uniref:Heptosyltransferase n=1 Tax=Leptospirillum ferriphilum YSK TaxID=1441628 RepID=A0A059Y2H8_9BACT|nr:glycosyltransferase family 9 protein [Leptospirillum ferriphilum]AIA31692.1 hypothetical protein Y981_05940 [Leptospirillum ferriphilum YSK]
MGKLGSCNRILIIKPSSLGDIVHCFPLVDEIRRSCPGSEVDWVANTEYVSLVKRYPGVRKVLSFPRSKWGKATFFHDLRFFISDLREDSYDAVVDAQGLLRSALIARACRTDVRIGSSEAREGASRFYSHIVYPENRKTIVHAVQKNLRLLGALGLTPRYSSEKLIYDSSDQDRLDRILRQVAPDFSGDFFVLHPGAKRSIKRWPSLYFSNLLDSIHRYFPSIRPVLIGAPEDRSLLEEIDGRTRSKAVLLPGVIPIDLLPLFFEKALFYVGNDSGPLHLAVMAGVPTVSFYGSSTPERTGPFDGGKGNHVVLGDKVPCSPCGDFQKHCDHQSCLVGVTPEAAFSKILSLIPQRNQPSDRVSLNPMARRSA